MPGSDVRFVGVDWAKRGWFSVGFGADEGVEFHFGRFGDLVEQYINASLVLVDAPIGIPIGQIEGRLCDKAARKKVGQRFSSSVFRVPTREAFQDRIGRRLAREDASQREALRTGGPGINRQSWGIIPQIAEVDAVMTSLGARRSSIREVHPELCFWGLDNRKPLAAKKDDQRGQEERVRILEPLEPRVRRILGEALRLHGHHAAPDDILDALAAAVTAREGYPHKLQTVPENPPRDLHGLPMEMVFYNPNP